VVIAVVRWDCNECGTTLVDAVFCCIPLDQAAALMTIGEIYSMHGKKNEAKKVRLKILRSAEHVTMFAVWACMVNQGLYD